MTEVETLKARERELKDQIATAERVEKGEALKPILERMAALPPLEITKTIDAILANRIASGDRYQRAITPHDHAEFLESAERLEKATQE